MNVKDNMGRGVKSDTKEGRTEQGKSTGKILEDMFTAVTFAERNLPEKARQYLDAPPRVRTVSRSLEDAFVAGAYAEEGAHETAREFLDSRPPLAGRVYGDIVYWGTVAATILTIIGQVVTFVSKSTFMTPSYVLSSIWQQESVEQIWKGAIGHLPQGHWYLKHLGTGPGITEMSLAFGVFIVIPALVGSGLILFRERNRLFGSLAVTAAVITTVSMVGLLPLPVG
ncbi:MAG: hypothetical protein K9J48_04065 [Desulfohalobiaceae bacterium]|nr:hypothetical protein [Desulfohalobiaceae bacterium]